MGSRTGTGGKPKNLYKREGVYYARIQHDGNERRRSLKTRDLREAERRLKRILAELSPYHGSTRRTFKEAAIIWLEAGEWKPKTAAGYAKLLNKLLEHFGEKYWDQVDKAALMEFAAILRQKGANPVRPHPAKSATVNRYLTVVSQIAEHVRDLPGWPEINPVRLMPKKARKEKRQAYVRPPASHIDAYFARMHSTFGDLCRAALLTGARKDELVHLTEGDAGTNLQLWNTKSHFRVIPASGEMAEIVARHKTGRDEAPLFKTRNGGPYKRVTEMWREVRLRAQNRAQKEDRSLVPMRFHDLRHEYAIRYLEAGGSLYVLQKLLGHGSVRQTEWYLRYLTPDQAAHAVDETAQKAAHLQRFASVL